MGFPGVIFAAVATLAKSQGSQQSESKHLGVGVLFCSLRHGQNRFGRDIRFESRKRKPRGVFGAPELRKGTWSSPAIQAARKLWRKQLVIAEESIGIFAIAPSNLNDRVAQVLSIAQGIKRKVGRHVSAIEGSLSPGFPLSANVQHEQMHLFERFSHNV